MNSSEQLIKCHLYHNHYGSDHQGTYSKWSLQPEQKTVHNPRRVYEKADWEQIRQMIRDSLESWPTITSEGKLDSAVEKLIWSTITAIDQFTPLA